MTLKLDEFLPYRLSRLNEAVSNEIRPVYRDMYGLNRPEWRVLVAIAEIGPTTAKDIGKHSAQHKTKVSRAVHALQKRRWISGQVDPEDRRSEILTLTKMGEQAYNSLIHPVLKEEARVMGLISNADQKQLLRVITKLEKAMNLI